LEMQSPASGLQLKISMTTLSTPIPDINAIKPPRLLGLH
jgi:hypothetical protein